MNTLPVSPSGSKEASSSPVSDQGRALASAQHTPLPWATEGSFVIHPASGMTVADCQLHRDIPAEVAEDEANAEFIARAVNSHYALLSSLKAVLADVDAGNAETKGNSRWPEAHAAIAKAEGTK